MKKNRIILIIAITLLILGIIVVCLFFTFGKNEKVDPPKKDDKEQTEVKAGYDEFEGKGVATSCYTHSILYCCDIARAKF